MDLGRNKAVSEIVSRLEQFKRRVVKVEGTRKECSNRPNLQECEHRHLKASSLLC